MLQADGAALHPPARLGLIGPSGAGKTTLIERLIGLRDAQPGEARLGDIDVADLTPEDRRPLFAYAAQDVRLIDGTVRENLLLAGPADDDALWRALDDAALAERLRADPAGLDARIGPNGERLSGGERRRLGLARAYLRPADVDALDAEWAALGLPAAGIPRLVRAEDKPWGMRELALIDPDGNLIRAGQELPLG